MIAIYQAWHFRDWSSVSAGISTGCLLAPCLGFRQARTGIANQYFDYRRAERWEVKNYWALLGTACGLHGRRRLNAISMNGLYSACAICDRQPKFRKFMKQSAAILLCTLLSSSCTVLTPATQNDLVARVNQSPSGKISKQEF